MYKVSYIYMTEDGLLIVFVRSLYKIHDFGTAIVNTLV